MSDQGKGDACLTSSLRRAQMVCTSMPRASGDTMRRSTHSDTVHAMVESRPKASRASRFCHTRCSVRRAQCICRAKKHAYGRKCQQRQSTKNALLVKDSHVCFLCFLHSFEEKTRCIHRTQKDFRVKSGDSPCPGQNQGTAPAQTTAGVPPYRQSPE